MEKPKKRKKDKTIERSERLEWHLFLGEVLLFLPRNIGRLIRWIADLF